MTRYTLSGELVGLREMMEDIRKNDDTSCCEGKFPLIAQVAVEVGWIRAGYGMPVSVLVGGTQLGCRS